MAQAPSLTCCRERRGSARARPGAGGARIDEAPRTRAAPNKTRVPALARTATSSIEARSPSPSRPVMGTVQGVQAAPPVTCAVPSTTGGRRSRSNRASTSATPPAEVASDASRVASAGNHPEQRTKPGAGSDTARIDRSASVASRRASARVGAAYIASGSPIPTWTQSISASTSSPRDPPTK